MKSAAQQVMAKALLESWKDAEVHQLESITLHHESGEFYKKKGVSVETQNGILRSLKNQLKRIRWNITRAKNILEELQ